MLERFTAIYQLELRMVLRHWAFWVVTAIWSGIHFIEEIFHIPIGSAEDWLVGGFLRNTVAFMGMAVLVMAALSVSRTRRLQFDVLEKSYPVDIETLAGRWLAVFTASLGFLIAPLVVAWQIGSPTSFLRGAAVYIPTVMLAFAVAISLVFLVHLIIGMRRWVYPLLIIGWVGSIFLAVSSDPESTRRIFSIVPSSFFGYSEMFGHALQRIEMRWHSAFYVGVLLGLIGVLVWRYRLRWLRYQSRIGQGLAAGGVLLALVSVGNYAYHLQQTASEHAPDWVQDEVTRLADIPLGVTDYDITADFAGRGAQFDVTMQVTNISDASLEELVFTLNHHFAITESNLSTERNWQFLTMTLDTPLPPGEAQTVSLTYGTEARELPMVRPSSSGRPLLLYEDAVELLYGERWYPIAGHRSPFGFELAQPVDATMRIEVLNGGADNNFASNLTEISDNVFAEDGVEWAVLVGSPRVAQRSQNNIDLVTANYTADKYATAAFESVTEKLAVYRDFYPSLLGVNLFFHQHLITASSLSLPMTGDQMTMAISTIILEYVNNPAEAPAWLEDPGEFLYLPIAKGIYETEDSALVQNVAFFTGRYDTHAGDAAAMREDFDELPEETKQHYVVYTRRSMQTQWSSTPPQMPRTMPEQPLAFADLLLTLYERDGTAAVSDLLQATQANADVLNDFTPLELVSWANDWDSSADTSSEGSADDQ